MRRPPDSASTVAADFANSAPLRSGAIAIAVISRIRRVTALAAASMANGSNVAQAMRSVTPRVENGPRSARLAHSSKRSPETPGESLGRLTPTLTWLNG